MVVDERTREPAATGPEGTPPQRPWWPTALLLLGFVLAVFAAAILLDRRYRTPIGSDPSLATALASQPTRALTATVRVTAPSPAPTSTVAVTPAVAAAQTSAPVSTAVASSAAASATAVPPTTSAKTGGGTPPVPAVQTALAQLPPLEREVAEAHLRYWEVRIDAYYDADPSRLKEVMGGAELAREEQQVRDLAAQGRAASLDVEHNFRIVRASTDEAVVYDEYVNRSRLIDKATKQPLPDTAGELVEKVSYQFKKIDGVWKVVDGTRNG